MKIILLVSLLLFTLLNFFQSHAFAAVSMTKRIVTYPLTLDEMVQMQMKTQPQTDHRYSMFVRGNTIQPVNDHIGIVIKDETTIKNAPTPSSWTINTVKKGDQLSLLSKVKGKDGSHWFRVLHSKQWFYAHPKDVRYNLDPSTFLANTVQSLQFAKLSQSANLQVNEVNNALLKGKGILEGTAKVFISAAKKYRLNEVYLLSHALLETGNGASALANGISYKGKTVFNMYGIGAVDHRPLEGGAKYAYEHGWFTREQAIRGGAAYIGANYIKNGQDTLYKMRWNPEGAMKLRYASHQYASDVRWATKQVTYMSQLYKMLSSYHLSLEIPAYQKR
ncbi:Mannosyl-glycoprotein endo-beta-N-acetylglucosaminidase [Fictibacillus macauensis ZFHKF-1]|uniref:Mannosyl-glycoprotein endo-beta-N-acetylglucosaminidase n=1 Tax=Fictibacillus macauensis ZFHKF-1 TaxID=1196324 RepID=I8AH86_9BACL|nr:N-acetylglucosaminidase [Fictibacillus macauensis]EIT84794.1 Mannosyl-glycoprotein endo-beta-N-acetylglucosaminidase [Fictibacillus macauensis ZFHKF-1]